MYDCIIIGAGAAGLFAAISAAEKHGKVLVLEKNRMAGKKLSLTGKGRCNITNACSFEDLIENIPGNGKFLYSALTKFSNYDIIDFFNSADLETVIERGNRVFPASGKAADVISTLLAETRKHQVEIKYGYEVTQITYHNDCVTGVYANGELFNTKNVIVATGGLSYPGTGSTGDGFKFAREAGHQIAPPKPSLVPLVSPDKWIKDLEGLSLKNVSLSLVNKEKTFFNAFGEMLFTSNGISGPMVLSGSRHYLDQAYKEITAVIDLKPALSERKLEERLKRDFVKYSRKQLKNAFHDLLPSKMIPVFLFRIEIDDSKFVHQITKEERGIIISLIKNFSIRISGYGRIEEAVVTVGGVKVGEINPSTMESKLKKGLFFAGEVMDVDGYTGGFNLTIAFSTGYAAGRNIRI